MNLPLEVAHRRKGTDQEYVQIYYKNDSVHVYVKDDQWHFWQPGHPETKTSAKFLVDLNRERSERKI